MNLSSDYDFKPIAPAEFKFKLLFALDDRYAVTITLYWGVGQDGRIFLYQHTSGTSFTLMYSSQIFEAPEDDELSSEANWERCHNDSVYWRLYNDKGHVFVSSGPGSAPWMSPEADVGDVFVPLGWLVEHIRVPAFTVLPVTSVVSMSPRTRSLYG